MKTYVIKKKNKNKEIVDLNEAISGFRFIPKKKKVTNITVVSSELINKIIKIKFDENFKRLVLITKTVLNDDNDDGSGVSAALNEELKIENMIKNRYNKYLTKEKQRLYLKKLALVEKELKIRQVLLYEQFMSLYENKGKSR